MKLTSGKLVAYRRGPKKVLVCRVVAVEAGLAEIQDVESGVTYRVWPHSPQLRAATKHERQKVPDTGTPAPAPEPAVTSAVQVDTPAIAVEPETSEPPAVEPEAPTEAALPVEADMPAEEVVAPQPEAEPDVSITIASTASDNAEIEPAAPHEPGPGAAVESGPNPDTLDSEIQPEPAEPATRIQTHRAIAFTTLKGIPGRLVPVITGGTRAQLRYANDLLRIYATQTPPWLTDLVCDEANLCHATDISNSVSWIAWLKYEQKLPVRRLYGTLHGILELCLRQYARNRTHVPSRLLAVLLYVGNGRSTARSPRLDKMLKDHPLVQDDEGYIKDGADAYPLRVWGQIAEEGLRLIDPEAAAPRWIAATEKVMSIRPCAELPCGQMDLYTHLIVLTTEGVWWRVTAVAWITEDNRYEVTVAEEDGRRTRRKVAPADVIYCFLHDKENPDESPGSHTR